MIIIDTINELTRQPLICLSQTRGQRVQVWRTGRMKLEKMKLGRSRTCTSIISVQSLHMPACRLEMGETTAYADNRTGFYFLIMDFDIFLGKS